jgi:ribulose-5-phosphate 4-epimerase/fuculose-1-phosphate aldolase
VTQLNELIHDLVTANRICAYEGVIDAFGHVSMRHPFNSERYLLSRSRSPELVESNDLIEFDMESVPVSAPNYVMYYERFIHGEIYKARPDVMAICHHHCPSLLPYCITGEKLIPVYHLGAVIGLEAPFWDQRDEFGDTDLLVKTPSEGASLARALGEHSIVLMRRHGATVVGGSLRELVFRTIYSCRNAEYQTQTKVVGSASGLSPGEIKLAGRLKGHLGLDRAWEYWVMRLEKHGGTPAAP